MPPKQICQRGTESCDSYVESENGKRQYKLTAGSPRPACAAEIPQQQMKNRKNTALENKVKYKKYLWGQHELLSVGQGYEIHWAFLNLFITASDLEMLFLRGHT